MSRSGRHDGTVVVIGGGCSGILAATHVLRAAFRPVDVVLIEPAERLGGLAYATTDPRHLLNSPAREMSAFSEMPDDFLDWLAVAGMTASGTTFAPRMVYRDYLAALPQRARADAPALSDVEWIREPVTAISLRETPHGVRAVVGLAHGAHIEAADVVLALGVPPSRGLSEHATSETDGIVTAPFQPGALDGIRDRVLLLGSGLTAIDVALSLERHHGLRRVHIRSRHAKVPLAHRADALVANPSRRARLHLDAIVSARALLRAVREAADKEQLEGGHWERVVSDVRQAMPTVWAGLDEAEQARALRHLLRYWEIHRHRVAPESAAAFDAMRGRGLVDLARGTLSSIERRGDHVEVHLCHGGRSEVLCVDAVVDCTGPAPDYGEGSALVHHLITTGLAQRGPHGLGLATDRDGDLLDARGRVQTSLHAIGWARRGSLLETTAVPELRLQAEALARRLAHRR